MQNGFINAKCRIEEIPQKLVLFLTFGVVCFITIIPYGTTPSHVKFGALRLAPVPQKSVDVSPFIFRIVAGTKPF